jgi:signal transduction histidine kinase
MGFLADRSIRGKLRWLTGIATLLSLTLFATVIVVHEVATYRRSLRHELVTLAEIMGSNAASSLMFQDPEFATATLGALTAVPHVRSALLLKADGTVFARYGTPSSLVAPAGALAGPREAFTNAGLTVARPIRWRGDVVGTVVMESSLGPLAQSLTRFAWLLAVAVLVSALVTFLIAEQLQRSLSRPLLELQAAARRTSADHAYGRRVEPRGKDEIGHLAAAFNDMLDEIERRDRKIKEANDLLEARVAERTLELAKAMVAAQAANIAKSQFLANISHELRTPMHGILSFARFGIDKGPTAGPEKVASYFEKIHQSAAQLLAMLNELLDLAKLQAGRMTYSFSDVNIADIVRQAADEFVSLVSERDLTLVCPSIEDVSGEADAQRTLQVVRNLLSNAVKFSPQGGMIYLSCAADDNAVHVSVRDQGPGIPEGELETIFEKFAQSSATTTGAGGTGLGLAICRQIVKDHGGRIWARNAPEGGALFQFWIPRARPAGGQQEERLAA